MTFRNTLLVAAAVLSTATAHIIMEKPVPYSKDKIDSGPISADQFPCKSQNGFTVSELNKMAVGETQQLKFKAGGAPHGGGACQLSVALTDQPDKNTVFKVVKTILGGCPEKDFDFQLPESIPNGKATFAWTWFPFMSGAPEMYMNCAPIEVSGGANDDSGFSQLPDMLVANIASTTCTKTNSENGVLKIPNPGEVVEIDPNAKFVEPSGDCGPKGNSPPAQVSSRSAPAQEQPTATPVVPSNPGGIFAPGASGAPSSTTTTLVTVTASPSPKLPPTQPTGTGAPAAPKPTAPPSEGSNSCTNEGGVVCNGESQFGLCNFGKVVWQQVSAGTACVNGTIQKRSFGRYARNMV